MVKRDPCWRAKKAVRQETNHLDFRFRFKDGFCIMQKCMGLPVYLFPKTLRRIQYSKNIYDEGNCKVFKLISSSVCLWLKC